MTYKIQNQEPILPKFVFQILELSYKNERNIQQKAK